MKKLSLIYNFYRNSLNDIFGFVRYLIAKVIKFNLIIIITIILLLILYKILTINLFSSVLGVVISIIAAVMFEGYRSYRKFSENNKIVLECYDELKSAINRFTISLLFDTNVIHLSVISKFDYTTVKINDNNIKNLRNLLVILEKFDNLKILPNLNNKFANEEYEVGIVVYQLYKTCLIKYLDLQIERILNVLVIYCDDCETIKDFYELHNSIKKIVENDIWPEAFRKGQPGTTYFLIIKLTKQLIKIVEKIEQ